MPGANLAMAREGTQFAGDGVNLSWPRGGEREISPKPDYLSQRLLLRIANGYIVETDEEPTIELPPEPATRLLFGREAREVFDQPATPVRVRAEVRTRDPKPEDDRRLKHLVETAPGGPATVNTEQVPVRPKKAARPRGALLKKK